MSTSAKRKHRPYRQLTRERYTFMLGVAHCISGLSYGALLYHVSHISGPSSLDLVGIILRILCHDQC